MSARLSADAVTVGYGETPVIQNLSMELPDAMVTTIIGPNGCGKSTLLRTLARLLHPGEGAVCLDGRPLTQWSTKDLATQLALLPQSPVAPDGLLVADLIARGRHPHQRWFRQWSAADEDAVEEALDWTSLRELKHRPMEALSGGQRQRAWIAMTLAQGTDLVLLDEPTTYLDLAHQVDLLTLVSRLNREQGRTVGMVLHDLNLAARFSDVIIVMSAGCIVAQGDPREVFTRELLQEVFALDADVLPDPSTGVPLVVPRAFRQPLGIAASAPAS